MLQKMLQNIYSMFLQHSVYILDFTNIVSVSQQVGF